jgi:hypothetical protein
LEEFEAAGRLVEAVLPMVSFLSALASV